METAKRELQEETGVVKFEIEPICVYSVTGKTRVNETGGESFGLLCFAEILEFSGKLENEIEEIKLMEELGGIAGKLDLSIDSAKVSGRVFA